MDAVKGEMERIRRLCVSIKHFAPNLKVILQPKARSMVSVEAGGLCQLSTWKESDYCSRVKQGKVQDCGNIKRNHQCFGEPSPGRRLHLLPVHASARESIQ